MEHVAGSVRHPQHDLIVELAKEVEDLGFDEIQLEYIRFPVDEGTRFATFPAW